MDGTLDDDDSLEAGMANAAPPEDFDARADDRDEAFVATQLPVGRRLITDGTLSCPCCFSVVCYECQRHVEYHTQFRALDTVNTRIKYDKALMYAVPNDEERSGQQERYCPVACATCGYECGVFGPDDDDVYHFFDVLLGPSARGAANAADDDDDGDADEPT